MNGEQLVETGPVIATANVEQTLDWLLQRLGVLGITRVAPITGLDKLGIPVTLVTRPASRSIAVAQGKGLTLAEAKVSGIMEAAETFHAERIVRPLRWARRDELPDALELDELPLLVTLPPAEGSLWVAGRELISMCDCWLPFELVSTDFTLPQPPGSGRFAANTNGLAAGCDLLATIVQALYELIERDAMALWRLRGGSGLRDGGVDLDSVDDPVCREVLEAYYRAKVEPRVWRTDSDLGVPVFCCLAVDEDPDWCDPELGMGCHLSPAIALRRALLEAAQARLTFISGARDDLGDAEYQPAQRRQRRQRAEHWFRAHRPCQSWSAISHLPSLHEQLDQLVATLRAHGLHQVVMVDLSREEIGIPVARVVVPGLEGAFEGQAGEVYRPGRRARRLLAS